MGAIAIAVGLLSSVLPARGTDDATADPVRFASPPPRFTLLDPEWILPPIETLDLALPGGLRGTAPAQLLDVGVGARTAPQDRPGNGKVGYSLSEDVTAEVGYHHSRLSDLATSRTLRNDQWSGFTTHPDRDVLDLNMSWHLEGNTVGVGYQFQSDRLSSPGGGAFSRFLPGSAQATHALTVGLTRTWGGAAPPDLVEAPPFAPDVAQESAPTPTPAQ